MGQQMYLEARQFVRRENYFAIIAATDFFDDIVVGLDAHRFQLELANLVNGQLLFAAEKRIDRSGHCDPMSDLGQSVCLNGVDINEWFVQWPVNARLN